MGVVIDAMKERPLRTSGGVYDNLLAMAKKLSHYDAQGQARMVDVSLKARTAREAEASAFVLMKPEVRRALPENPKGAPLEVARAAGIMAAVRAAEGGRWGPRLVL